MSFTIASPVGGQLAEMLDPWMNGDLALLCQAIGVMFDPLYALVTEQGTDGDPDYVPPWGTLFDPDLCLVEDLPYLAQYVGVTIPTGSDEATARALVKAESGMNRGTVASIRSAIERSISVQWAPNTSYRAGLLVTFGQPRTFYLVTTSFTSGDMFDTADLTETDPTLWYSLRERERADGTADAYWFTIQVRPEQLSNPNDVILWSDVSETWATLDPAMTWLDAVAGKGLMSAVNLVKPGGVMVDYVFSDSPRWEDASRTWATSSATSWQRVQPSDV